MLLTILALAADPCGSAATQSALSQCASARSTRADAAMNRQWQTSYAIAKRRGAGYAATVLAAQRAWLTFRDAECKAQAGKYAGGTMMPMVAARCRSTLTEARTVQLRLVAAEQ